MRLDRRVDAVDVRKVGYIALDRGGVVTNGGNRSVELCPVAARDEHLRAFFREALGRAKANTGAAARYNCDFAFELLAHENFLSDRICSLYGRAGLIARSGGALSCKFVEDR
jgi:hypothetical protein